MEMHEYPGNRINARLLTQAVERILSRRYGKTVTVRITDGSSKSEEDEFARCSEAYKGNESS